MSGIKGRAGEETGREEERRSEEESGENGRERRSRLKIDGRKTALCNRETSHSWVGVAQVRRGQLGETMTIPFIRWRWEAEGGKRRAKEQTRNSLRHFYFFFSSRKIRRFTSVCLLCPPCSHLCGDQRGKISVPHPTPLDMYRNHQGWFVDDSSLTGLLLRDHIPPPQKPKHPPEEKKQFLHELILFIYVHRNVVASGSAAKRIQYTDIIILEQPSCTSCSSIFHSLFFPAFLRIIFIFLFFHAM